MSTIQINLDYQHEQIQDRIVTTAATHLIDQIGGALQREVQARVGPVIEARINAIVTEALERAFTPVDEFGDPKGTPTTVKAILSAKAKSFLEEMVDSSGKACTSHYSTRQPRANFLLGKLFEEALDHTAKGEIKKIAEQAKEKAHLEVAKLIIAQIQKP